MAGFPSCAGWTRVSTWRRLVRCVSRHVDGGVKPGHDGWFLGWLMVLACAPAVAAEPPRLTLPIECRLGETCWVMNYPDAEPGPAAKDFACRPRSYDGHGGTDIALRDLAAMKRGVTVAAAAAGIVVAARDGEPEGLWMAGRQAEVRAAGKECGNRVGIDHGNGWATDYCHLKTGSVMVKPGDKVAAGQPIGQVGLSGMTAFPHAHMGLLRLAQPKPVAVDPFTGAELAAGCGRPAAELWAQPVGYQPVSLYAAGFADHLPTEYAIMADAASPATLPAEAPALVVWGALFGVAPGDRVVVRLTGPDGAQMAERVEPMDKDQAWRFVAAGKKRPAGKWPAGTYAGSVTVERAGLAPQTRTISVELR
jgi:hypothetical protein